jgi:hypothetical protein
MILVVGYNPLCSKVKPERAYEGFPEKSLECEGCEVVGRIPEIWIGGVPYFFW